MGQYVAGWDGGGTKTAMQIRSLDGSLITENKSGALNYNSQNRQEICKTIDSLTGIMKNLPDGLEGCKGLCISTAGVSNKEAVDFIRKYVSSCGILCDITIVGDYEAALCGALGKSEGIVLISGTGSICFGKNRDGLTFRTGGYGHLIDDEGSGYAIGRDILTAAVRTYDKRIPYSILLDMVLEQIKGSTPEDIVTYTYRQNWSKTTIAALAPILLGALKREDAAAIKICAKTADELLELIIPVVRQLDLEISSIAFLGGILENYEPIRKQLIQLLSEKYPHLHVVKPLNGSAAGAAYIALEKLKPGSI